MTNLHWALSLTLLALTSVTSPGADSRVNAGTRRVLPVTPPSDPHGRVKQLANNGLPFQLICRGGAALRVSQSIWRLPEVPGAARCWGSGDYACPDPYYRWSIDFRRASQPADPTGRNLQPGECGPATFQWRNTDLAEIQTVLGYDGALPGVDLYPWEKPDTDKFANYQNRVEAILQYLKNPSIYWSFQIQQTAGFVLDRSTDAGVAAGNYFQVLSSQNWKPEFYRGPNVAAVESKSSSQSNPYVMGPQVPAAVGAAGLDVLAARGEGIANQDPLAVELRSRNPDAPSLRGFDIGMAAAEGNTEPGPGKQRIHDALTPAEQNGFDLAVSFSLQRNRNAKLAATGAVIASADEQVAQARSAEGDVFYWLGFDIASGIFGDPALGAAGNTATGPGSLGIRNSLNPAAQRGFNASVALHLSRRYK